MEIVITKCEVYLKKERLYDYEEFYNYLTHEIFLKSIYGEMKVIFKCKNQSQDYEDIYIYLNNEQNEFKYVGNLNTLLDYCEMDVECTDEELNLCMNLFNSLCNNIHLTFNEWTQNFEIHKEEKLDEQCNFNLPQKLKIGDWDYAEDNLNI